MSNSLLKLPINKLHQKLKSKEISALELAKQALKQAKTTNQKTNAFITICEQAALKQAKQADQAIASGTINPLTGIPFVMKDAYLTKDITTTSASNILKNYQPPYSATVYQRLREKHAVLIGKNNQDAWGHGASSENTDFGPVKNPWDLERTAGGSSGGTAAAIASHAGIFGIAEDTGGSIRNPSSFCNTTGLKVTYGRVSRYGTIAYASSLDTVGPIAKNVEDAALIMQAIAGEDPMDATTAAEPVPFYSKNLSVNLKGKTIGLVKEYFEDNLEPEVGQTLDAAIQQFKKLGANVKEVSLPTAKYGVTIYYLIALSETSSNLARYDGIRYGQDRSQFTKETMRRIMLGTFSLSSGYYDAYYKSALKARTKLIQEFESAFKSVDVLLAPVMPFPAYKFGEMGTQENYIVAMYLADLYTCATNPAGIPSLALPAGFSKNNLPIGMQLMGPMFSEDTLLNFGHQYQQATNWHTKKPPILTD